MNTSNSKNSSKPSFLETYKKKSNRVKFPSRVSSINNDNYGLKNKNLSAQCNENPVEANNSPMSLFSIDEVDNVDEEVKRESSTNVQTREIAIECEFPQVAKPKITKKTRFDLSTQHYQEKTQGKISMD